MMVSTFVVTLLIAFAGNSTGSNEPVVTAQLSPEMESSLLNQVGWDDSFVAKYYPDERVAFVYTPAWMPEVKPYQFDGENWIPLWSPYHEPGEEEQCPQ